MRYGDGSGAVLQGGDLTEHIHTDNAGIVGSEGNIGSRAVLARVHGHFQLTGVTGNHFQSGLAQSKALNGDILRNHDIVISNALGVMAGISSQINAVDGFVQILSLIKLANIGAERTINIHPPSALFRIQNQLDIMPLAFRQVSKQDITAAAGTGRSVVQIAAILD